MEHLVNTCYIRRDRDVAFHLARTLEPTSHILTDGNNIITAEHPSIDYRRDSLLEIHKRLSIRHQIAMANVD